MTPSEEASLLEDFNRAHARVHSATGFWDFEYEHPGFFTYIHESGQKQVYFTPDWSVPGMVSIQIEEEGHPRRFFRHPFTSMRAHDLFNIVMPYLHTLPSSVLPGFADSRKHWDPRMGAARRETPLSEKDRQELERALLHYFSRHIAGEFYEFNIRVRRVDIPHAVREQLSEDELNQIVQQEMDQRLQDFVEDLKERFRWIHSWRVEGRSGGWLVLEPDYQVLDEHGELEDTGEGRKRLRDLNRIDRMIREGIVKLERDLASHDYWASVLPSYFPGRWGRKHWDPRQRA